MAARADVSLLRHYDLDADRAEPFAQAPYVSIFSGVGRTLVFLAADHVSGPDNATFRTVAWAFAERRPEAVVVEGVRAGAETLYDGELESYRRVGYADCPESLYAASLARLAGVPFLGGEPDPRVLFDEVIRAGYAPEDYVGRWIFAYIPHWRRTGRLSAESLPGLVDSCAAREAAEAGIDMRFGFAEFARWFEAHKSPGQELLELTGDDSAPIQGPGSSYFQRLASAADLTREAAVVRRVEDAFEGRRTVLIVYGAGHLVKQRPVWEGLLGRSESLKPF